MQTKPIRINGKAPLLHKLVFELRYERGFLYLDRCGSIMNTIVDVDPAWMANPNDPSPQGAMLINSLNNCSLNFSSKTLVFSVEQGIEQESLSQDDVDSFVKQVDEVTPLVIEGLGLKLFERVGFRIWYLFACDDNEEAVSWLDETGCFSIHPGLADEFNGRVGGTTLATVIETDDRSVRIGFTALERKVGINLGGGILNVSAHQLHSGQREHRAKQVKARKLLRHLPEIAAMIDFDFSQKKPTAVRPKAFIESSIEMGLASLARFVSKENVKGEGG